MSPRDTSSASFSRVRGTSKLSLTRPMPSTRLSLGRQKLGAPHILLDDWVLVDMFNSCSKQQALMEASALAQQVEEIGRCLSNSKDVIDPEARKIALEKLIELRRLEQLKAIAESRSNSTYFFGDRCKLASSCVFCRVSLKDVLVFSAALGLDPYNIDYAEHVKGGLHERDGKARTAQSDSAAAVTAL